MKFATYVKGKRIGDDACLEDFLNQEIGIFETMRVYGGKIFRLRDHLNRLFESAKTAGYKGRIDVNHLEGELKLAVRAFGKESAVIRLTLWQKGTYVMIGERKHPDILYQQGVSLRTSPVKRSLTHAAAPEAKTTAYQNAVLATLEPRTEEVYEWVFLDRAGFVTEVRIGNLFVITREGKLFCLKTPPLPGILNGVTRRLVIECASRAGLPVRECPLTRHDVFTAQEAFLTNTTWELLPIRKLDGRSIGHQIPGLWTSRLHRLYQRKVKKECQIR